MRKTILFIASLIVLALVYLTSSSFASLLLSIITLLLGGLMILLFGKNDRERFDMLTVLLVSFVVITLATVIKYLDYIGDYGSFAESGNDNYKFFLASQEGEFARSIYSIFVDCVLQNIHYENGGYYFYIDSIAFLASKYADGNHILLQQLGTALPSILGSVVLYSILSKYCSATNVVGYTCFFMVFSPLIMHSVGIHRDAMIAFLYFLLIYLWLCKDFSWRVGFVQIGIAVVLYFIRDQHGLFALSFFALSAVSSHKQNRLVYIIAAVALVLAVWAQYLSNLIVNSMTDTSEYYSDLRAESLSGLSSGIGRYVFMLPFPLKEIALIFFLQLRFPPWYALAETGTIFSSILGVLSFIIAIYWFYVFSITVVSLIKERIKCLPRKLVYGLILLLLFMFLNSYNLESRRVVCMYPLLYATYVYYQDNVLLKKSILLFRRNYILLYLGLCVIYLFAKVLLG